MYLLLLNINPWVQVDLSRSTPLEGSQGASGPLTTTQASSCCLLFMPLCAPLGSQVWPCEKSESQMLSQNSDIAGKEAALFLEPLAVALRNR